MGSRGPGNGDVATRLGRVGDARSRRRAGAADDRTADRRLHPAVQPPGSTAPPSARAHGCVHNVWPIMRTAPKSVRGLDSSFRERELRRSERLPARPWGSVRQSVLLFFLSLSLDLLYSSIYLSTRFCTDIKSIIKKPTPRRSSSSFLPWENLTKRVLRDANMKVSTAEHSFSRLLSERREEEGTAQCERYKIRERRKTITDALQPYPVSRFDSKIEGSYCSSHMMVRGA